MFWLTTTKMSKFITIHLSHFGCIKSTILTGLRQMHIDSSCPNLGICIKISNVSINSAIIDSRMLPGKVLLFTAAHHS